MPAVLPSAQAAPGRGAKRTKLDDSTRRQSELKQRPARSRLFAPFRTVGLICPTNVPFTTVALGKTTFQITTSVGRSLQTYDLRRGLNLVFITRPQTPGLITAIAAWEDRVLAAWRGEGEQAGRGVWVFRRGKKMAELEAPKGSNESIVQLVVFGAWIVGCSFARIDVWKSATLEHHTTLIVPRIGVAGSLLTGRICHMPTYLNKVFAGRQDGSVDIWNVNTGRLLYTILPAAADYGHVTALQPTPALSLIAIAYSSGPVVIHNIRSDKRLLAVNTGPSRKACVTSIAFRTDGQGAGTDGRKDGVMATASKDNGDVVFWDLNGGGRKIGVLRGAHAPPSAAEGGVAGGTSKIEFLAGQAVVVTSGLDNALKTWISDQTPFSALPRILHSRSGHAAPVSTLQFLPSDADGAEAGGKWLVSASKDRTFRAWSLRRDGQSTELSQGNIQRKAKRMGLLSEGLAALDSSLSIEDLRAPMITRMACSLNRDGGMGAVPGANSIWSKPGKSKGAARSAKATGLTGWESIVTAHAGSKAARSWFWGKKKAGRWALDTGDRSPVSSVCVSQCGTFALVGSRAGGLNMFNLQSGIHRQRFPSKPTPQEAKRLRVLQLEAEETVEANCCPGGFARGQGKHTGAVTGIATDGLNRTVISCGEDGKVKFWDFANGQLRHEIDWHPLVAIHRLCYHSSSDLIAFGCSDSSIRIVDIETKKLVRELFGCRGHISDFVFSNDGRWIIAASADCVIRTWDLPTGHPIDAMKLRSKCTSLSMSATGEYLAVAQEDSVGVGIWTNKTLFGHVSTRRITDDEIAEVDTPSASGEGGKSMVVAAHAAGAHESDGADEQEEQEDAGLPPLGQLNEAMTTLSLVPRSMWQNLIHLDLIRERNKPKEAPKAPERAPFFLPHVNGATKPAADSTAQAGPLSRISNSGPQQSSFSRHLSAASETGEHDALLSYLATLAPNAADLAIRSLSAPPSQEFVTFINALTARLRQKRDYELVQAWMAVFLRLHGEDIPGDDAVVEAVKAWRKEGDKESQRLGSQTSYCAGVVGFLRSAR